MNKMATVVGFFEETKTAKIQFDGEDKPAEKEYPYLSSYSPKLDDKVFCLEFGESFIILGEVTFQKKPFDLNETLTNSIEPKIKALSDKHDADKTELTTKIVANAKSIEANKSAISTNKSSTDSSISKLWNSVNSNTNKVKTAQNTADSVNRKFNDLESKVNSNTSRSRTNETNISAIKKDMTRLSSDVSSIRSNSLPIIENDIKSLKSRVAALEKK
jgi:chromosome segregation ATPase